MDILIVEDDELTAKIIFKHLKKNLYNPKVVCDGESCLKFMESNAPSLILLDYMLPGISGLEVLKTIREKHGIVELPIILVTAKTDTKDVVSALKIGANDYIKKPINFDILSARIKTQLQLRQYHLDSIRSQELEAINAMIVTYNHEINNPLAAAIFSVELLENKLSNESNSKIFKCTNESLSRISEILKTISKVTNSPIKKETYIGSTKMIEIDKKKTET